ncbi:MAG TPA: hypothetical protein VFX28_20410 [Methylomirabilota bacterium]|nr:hypothetical protein [Methylomirabilota bacterium]
MTLADLLVALAVTGVLLTGALGLLEQGRRAYEVGAARVEAQQAARVALARLARDIRHAGAGGAIAAVAVAEPQRLVLQQDLDGDGAAVAPGETVTWRLAGSVLRRDAGAGGQPVINGVRDLRLVYLDADGNPATGPADVRSVDATLTTGPDHATSAGGSGVGARMATRVALRNR